ncbi:MAG: hypothetical protein K0U98_14095 [Deltaproteobacteria bacterium]|nr:hypothetical protein [Deltaproteobacteria bacterium]
MAGIGNERGAKGCFKFGCFGCLVLIALMFGIPALLALVGLLAGSQEPRYESVTTQQILPGAEGGPEGGDHLEAPVAPGEDLSGLNLEGQDLEEGQLGGIQRPGEGASYPDLEEGRESRRLQLDSSLAAAPPGVVRISLEMGEFTVEPGPPGSGIRLEGDYDEASFELKESYTQEADGSWAYGVELESKRGFMSFFGNNNISSNKLRLILPRGQPMAVEGRIRAGESTVDLGGLFLTGVDLELKLGDHDLKFSEPTAEPLESVSIESSWGEIDMESLGNASPKIVRFSGTGGEFDLDLRGDWANDTQVSVNFKLGECDIKLPEDTRISIDRASMTMGDRNLSGLADEEDLPTDAPTISLALRGALGELRVDR